MLYGAGVSNVNSTGAIFRELNCSTALVLGKVHNMLKVLTATEHRNEDFTNKLIILYTYLQIFSHYIY